MKRFIFEVTDVVKKEVSILADTPEEALQKLEEYDIEREDEIEGDMNVDEAVIKEVEEI